MKLFKAAALVVLVVFALSACGPLLVPDMPTYEYAVVQEEWIRLFTPLDAARDQLASETYLYAMLGLLPADPPEGYDAANDGYLYYRAKAEILAFHQDFKGAEAAVKEAEACLNRMRELMEKAIDKPKDESPGTNL